MSTKEKGGEMTYQGSGTASMPEHSQLENEGNMREKRLELASSLASSGRE